MKSMAEDRERWQGCASSPRMCGLAISHSDQIPHLYEWPWSFQTISRRSLPRELPSADDPCSSLLKGCTNWLLSMNVFNKSHEHPCYIVLIHSKKWRYLERQALTHPTIGKTEFGAELHKLCKQFGTVVFPKLWLNVKSVEFSDLCSKKMYWRTCPYFYLCK